MSYESGKGRVRGVEDDEKRGSGGWGVSGWIGGGCED